MSDYLLYGLLYVQTMTSDRVSQHTAKDWRDQWRRVQRWHRKVGLVRAGGLPVTDDEKEEALDEVYAYFKECNTLADWVEKSGYRSKKAVWSFVDTNISIGLCRDIANGLRHFELDKGRKPSVDSSWSTATVVGASMMASNRGTRFIAPPYRWVVRAAGTEHDMFGLADQCLDLWSAFLNV